MRKRNLLCKNYWTKENKSKYILWNWRNMISKTFHVPIKEEGGEDCNSVVQCWLSLATTFQLKNRCVVNTELHLMFTYKPCWFLKTEVLYDHRTISKLIEVDFFKFESILTVADYRTVNPKTVNNNILLTHTARYID